MRWLLVADLHYSLPQYDWVMQVAGNFDVVIIAGDHLDTSSLVDCGRRASSSRNISAGSRPRPG